MQKQKSILLLLLFLFCCSVSRKYQFKLPNIHFAINCNNPVRFLFAQGVWQQPVLHTEIWSDHHPVCLEWHEETEQTETKTRGTVGTSPRCFKRPTCKGVMIFILYKLYFLSPYTNPTPKPTPFRKLSAFLDFQKTSFCMIYKLVCSWGPNIIPTRTRILPSVCGHFVPI